MPYPTALINVMSGAAEKAARPLRRDFGEIENLQVSLKGPDNFVTSADLRTQEILHRELARARPGYGFLMEEGLEEAGDGEHRWIVDPVDGTLNFLRGIPHFAISIALERAGTIVGAFVLDPIKHEAYWAEKGRGAYVNDRRLRITPRTTLEGAVIALGLPHRSRGAHDLHLSRQRQIMRKVAGLRRFGAAALDLCYVASGRIDGYWETGLNPWDIAGGMLCVTEAGGSVVGLRRNTCPLITGEVIAGTPEVAIALQDCLTEADPHA